MFNNDFEKAFEKFLGSKEYDLAEEALFSMARRGFIAGWRAAGGHVMAGQSVMETKSKYDVFQEKPTFSPPDVVPFPTPE